MLSFNSRIVVPALAGMMMLSLLPACSPVSGAAERAAARAAARTAERKAAERSAKAAATAAVARSGRKEAADMVVRRWYSVTCKPSNPCPLPHNISDTFVGGSYNEVVLGADTTLYRVYANRLNRLGPSGQRYSYWSRSDARGTQAVVDSAIPVSRQGNTATQQVAIRVPQGTRVFEGQTQGIPHGGPVGGGNQVVIDGVRLEWVIGQ